MLSEALYKQIFKEQTKAAASLNSVTKLERDSSSSVKDSSEIERDGHNFEAVEKHLSEHNLWGRETTVLEDINFDLPELHGQNIDEHFRYLATKQTEGYVALAEKLKNSKMPEKPKKWMYAAGWTKYGPKGEVTPVAFPEGDVYVFDVETLLQEGNYPTLATAVSDKYW